ncbi:MAG: hypothetical protein IKK39_02000 [Thermoguttaceae bacterium]|nr:hypothetical protein [Thermoguttaceae bacterium]MBR4102818.1 hypothetical protein [Thermoguttaceae bacterium]
MQAAKRPVAPGRKLDKKNREKMPKQADNNNATRRPTPEEYRAARRRVQRETARVVKRTLIGIALFAGMYYLFLATNARRVAPPNEPETPRATVDAENASPVETPVPNVDAENAPPVETPVENASQDAVATP